MPPMAGRRAAGSALHGVVTRIVATFSPAGMPKSPNPPTAPTEAAQPASYEQALQELDGLVERMESGQMPLDQLLDGYRRGSALLAFCRERLQAVEDQVRVLDDGQLRPLPPA